MSDYCGFVWVVGRCLLACLSACSAAYLNNRLSVYYNEGPDEDTL